MTTTAPPARELPTKAGLYQIVDSAAAPIEHEVTYRLTYQWVNALNNDPLTEHRLDEIARAYADGHLVRLVRKKVTK